MRRVIVTLGVVIGAVLAVVALRSSAMTVHAEMPASSRLVVEATARWRGDGSTAPRLSQALAVQCVAETSAEAMAGEFTWRDGPFSFEVTPSLDGHDRRRLRACLSDVRLPRLIVSVDHMRTIAPAEAARPDFGVE